MNIFFYFFFFFCTEKGSPDAEALGLALGMEEPPGATPPTAPPSKQSPTDSPEHSQKTPSPVEEQGEASALADSEVSSR